MEDYNSVAYEAVPPDESEFIEGNSTLLHAMAMWYEENIARYHIPQDMIVNTRFDSSTSVGNPVSYSSTTDSAEWTGHYLMGEAFRYAIHVQEGNASLAQDALNNITKALNGYDKILHVAPNGGMARYAWPLSEYPSGAVRDNRYLGEWNGQYYIYEDQTSRDMHNGVIMGLGMAYYLVNDTATREKIKGLVEDLLDYMLERGWLYVNPDGDPNGTDLDVGFWVFGTGGFWTLAYLKVGELVNPEKYGPLYREYAVERDYIHRSNHPQLSRTNLVQAYFGLLLDWELLFTLTTLEEDPALHGIYLDHATELYELVKYDRTTIFSAMWLALMGINRANKPSDSIVIRDIEDCLMRFFNASQRFPGRNYGVSTAGLEDPTSIKWYNYFTTGTGSILYPFWDSVYQFRPCAIHALAPDMRKMTDFLWSRSPYDLGGTGDGRNEGSGCDYTVVYWLCRYYDIIDPPGDYNLTLEATYGG